MKDGEILKEIYCPVCARQIHLSKKDFSVTVENERGEWSCDPAIVCPWEGCGTEFFITVSHVEPVKKKSD